MDVFGNIPLISRMGCKASCASASVIRFCFEEEARRELIARTNASRRWEYDVERVGTTEGELFLHVPEHEV